MLMKITNWKLIGVTARKNVADYFDVSEREGLERGRR
jgi:hypothetical protein